jgi:hypothetical protein
MPIEMPYPLMVNTKVFDLNHKQQITPSGAGFLQTIDRAPAFWIAKWSTPTLADMDARNLQQFLDQLEGAANTFLAFDARRVVPLAYVGLGYQSCLNNPPWGAGAQVTGNSYAGSTLTLGSFTPGTILSNGDYISYLNSPAWRLYRVYGGPYTVPGNGTLVVTVKPRPSDTITAAVNVRLVRACAEMKMPGDVQSSDDVSSGQSFSWSGIQYINRLPPS